MSAPNTYQDFRNKTVNWCTKLQQAGILSNDQMDNCISSVSLGGSNNRLSTQIPPSGPGVNYSIYNKIPANIANTFNIIQQNRNFITNSNGAYLSEDTTGKLYFNTANIDTSDVNQPDLIWTLSQQGQGKQIYAIQSPYGHYLIANPDFTVTSNGTSSGPASNWILNFTDTNIIAQSVLYNGYYLNFDPNAGAVTLSQDKNEFIAWTLYPVLTDNTTGPSQLSSSNIIQNLTTQKQQVLTALQTAQKHDLALKSSILALNQLRSTVNDRYTRTSQYINGKFNLTEYGISTDNQNQILGKISNHKAIALSDIDSKIADYNQQLTQMHLPTGEYSVAQDNYNKLTTHLSSLALNSNTQLSNNSSIINRQNADYNNYMEQSNYNKNNLKSYEDDAATMKLNMSIMDSYVNSNYTYSYPIIIIILIVGILVSSYYTYKKFRKNVLKQYD
uniref:Uncharacterized protein n=1 Tax=viral metagenome TaxID=1070528 RepID=A0A6C0HMQ4_9ZZZZ